MVEIDVEDVPNIWEKLETKHGFPKWKIKLLKILSRLWVNYNLLIRRKRANEQVKNYLASLHVYLWYEVDKMEGN